VEKTLHVIKELKKKKVIQDYAIGGGVAVLYYVEPLLTYDLDIFFIPVEDNLDVLSPVYTYLKQKGFKTHREHIMIEGVPVQFIPVYNELVTEAVKNSTEVKYGRMKTKVLGIEYLMAVLLQTYRPKDRERLVKMLEETEVDLHSLKELFRKFELYEKFTAFQEKYLDSR
jgi:hypothetical protein